MLTNDLPAVAFDHHDFAHTGPGTLAGRYMRRFWQPVCHAHDVAPGRTLPIRIMSENLTVYRGESGVPHVTTFRCPHRGTQLSAGWVEGDALRCYYHGWKYDAAGQCIEQPAEIESFAHKVRIASYPAIEYLGLIFAYLGEGDPPPLPRFPDFEATPGIYDWDSYDRRCNFFQNLENSLDNSHVGFVHRDHGAAFDGMVDRPVISVEENEWGISVNVKRTSGAERTTYIGLPNSYYMYALPLLPEYGWLKSLFWWVPVDDENHRQFVVRKLPLTGEAAERYRERIVARQAAFDLNHADLADEVLSGRITRDEVDASRTQLIRFQDDVAQVGQGAIADREHERLGHSDVGIIFLRKIWARELKALAEGKPIKQWDHPADMIPTPHRGPGPRPVSESRP